MNIKHISIYIIALIIFLLNNYTYSQNDSTDNIFYPEKFNKKRLTAVIATGSALYVGSMIGLYSMWYKDYPQTTFHFINDNNEWLQMDKMGHIFTSYYLGRIGYESLRWSGVNEKKSIWYGGLLGFTFLMTVEIFDGFSAEWGATTGDIIANGFGAALFIGQQLAWSEQRFLIKFSFHQTEYPQYNPELLGKNLIQEIIKDYNGETFWLSGNIHSFLRKKSRFPKWLNVAFGYGAEGMTGATNNPTKYEGRPIPQFDRYRQFYFSLDVDYTRIKTRSKVLKVFFTVISFIKIPFPTLEYNTKDGLKFHYLYF